MKKFLSFFLLALCAAQVTFAQTREEGFAAMQMEKWDKAIDIYSGLIKADPTDQESALTLSNAYLAKGIKDKALQVAEAAFTAKPEGNLAVLANARILMMQGKMADADKQFGRITSKGKKDPVLMRLYGESFFYNIAQGDTKPNRTRATEMMKTAYDMHTKDFGVLMSTGYIYREQGNGGEASRYYEYASQYAPKNPLPLFMVASVYKAAKLTDKYLTKLDEAIALNNSYTPALRAKADFLFYARKIEKAKDAYEQLLLNSKETTIEDEMQMANCLFLTKDYKGCTDLVEKIIAKDGSKNYLRRLLGYSYYETGDYPKGMSIMTDYFSKVTPDKILASDYIYYGRLLLKGKNDTVGAITNLKLAIDKDTAQWPLHQEVADLYIAKKDYCNAAIEYQLRMDSLGANAELMDYYRLGNAHYYCRTDSMHYQKALNGFVKITEKKPTALIGWFWSGKSAAKLEPDVVTNPDLVSQFGKAKPYFDEYIKLASVDEAKNKKDLITAYEYKLSYHFFRKEDAETNATTTKLLEMDPANKTGIGIRDAMQGGTPVPPPPPGGKN